MPQITISELPEPLQKLLQEAKETKTPLVITREGQPFAVVHLAKQDEVRPESEF